MRRIFYTITHGAALALGFALGIYMLPIWTAPSAPDAGKLDEMAAEAIFSGSFTRDLRGSDFFHWGEGVISLTPSQIVHRGKLAPGPDYRVYLVRDFVEHEDEFGPVKEVSLEVGSVKSFGGFILDLPPGVDLAAYSTVVIWCEAFGEFITAAKYR